MIQNKKDVVETLLLHKDVLRSYAVNRIGLFGSYKKETNNYNSDIDLLIEFLPQKKKFKNIPAPIFF